MIEFLFVSAVALLALFFGGWAAWAKLRGHAPAEVDSDPVVARVLAGDHGPPPPTRGVDRVPARLRFERTVPLPPALPNPVEFHEIRVNGSTRWVRAPYRNPDRAERLAKNGRLRAELRPG